MANLNLAPQNTPSPEEEKTSSLLNTIFPQQATIVFGTAVIIGLILIVLPPLFRNILFLSGSQSNLLLCVGVALILAAVGGQATVRVGSIIMAGAAAIALGFFLYLQWDGKRQVAQGSISSVDYEKYTDILIKTKHTFLGSIDADTRTKSKSIYRFVAMPEEINQKFLEIAMVDRKSEKEVFARVRTDEITKAFGNEEYLEWELHYDKDTDNSDIIQVYDAKDNRKISIDTATAIDLTQTGDFDFTFIKSAYAQTEMPSTEITDTVNLLKSDDTILRRSARDTLSTIPPSQISTLLDNTRNNFEDYRIRLGVSVALAQMLRNNKNQARLVASQLKPEDLNLLLDAAGDQDRTVRAYATEFLFDLGDPVAAKLAIQRASSSDDPRARYNWLFTAQDGWQQLSADERKTLVPVLDSISSGSGQQTQDLVGKFQR